LRKEINRLKNIDSQSVEEIPLEQEALPVLDPIIETQEASAPTIEQVQTTTPAATPRPAPTPVRTKRKSDLEKFIGENLINKIGIVITVIGVAIGANSAVACLCVDGVVYGIYSDCGGEL